VNPRQLRFVALATVLSGACGEPAAGPDRALAPNSALSRPAVLVNPNASEEGTARTIQQGINMAAPGGKVMVLPGTYDERIVIDKGLTLEGIADGSGPVVLEQVLAERPPLGGREAVIQVVTPDPVTIRGINVRHIGIRGLNNYTETSVPAPVHLTVDRMSFYGEFPFAPPFFNNGITVVNNTGQSGGRAWVVVRRSLVRVDGIGISLGGDLDAVIERNVMGGSTPGIPGACIHVSPTGQGVTVPAGAETNVDILDNRFEECGTQRPGQAVYGIGVLGAAGATTTGTVNIVGNTMRNTVRTPEFCNTSGITYEFYSGRIEHNVIDRVVQDCAQPAGVTLAAAIFVGSVRGFGPANPVVRFNDIVGNAHAGLRVAPNITTPIDATCNWWGSSSGPSSVGSSTGTDAIVLEAPAMTPTPVYLPFATAPIAGTGATGC
jgi:hypothetical protein